MDELDYMGDGDFDTVYALCMERDTIGLTCSSTPTGRRSKFYEICTNKTLKFSEHYHPTQHNPLWSDVMEEEFRNTYDNNAYVHEVLAEFGVEEAGVFDKIKLEPLKLIIIHILIEINGNQFLQISMNPM